MIWIILILGVILVLISAYGYKLSSKTAADYLLAGRAIGTFVMFFYVYFAISSAWTFYGFPGTIYNTGPGFMLFFSFISFAFLYIFIGPKALGRRKEIRLYLSRSVSRRALSVQHLENTPRRAPCAIPFPLPRTSGSGHRRRHEGSSRTTLLVRRPVYDCHHAPHLPHWRNPQRCMAQCAPRYHLYCHLLGVPRLDYVRYG